MPSDLLITVALKDASGKELMSLASHPVPPLDAKAVSESYKEIYKECLNHYRFFGALRAQVAWPPATIMGTALAYFSANTDIKSVTVFGFSVGPFFLPVVLLAVLILINIINYQLQQEQARYTAVAKLAQDKWLENLKSNAVSAHSYSELKKKAVYRKRPDAATILFSLFSIALMALIAIVTRFPK